MTVETCETHHLYRAFGFLCLSFLSAKVKKPRYKPSRVEGNQTYKNNNDYKN